MISSHQNQEFKELVKLRQRKIRQRLGRFVAEGVRLVSDALDAGWHPEKLVLAPPLLTAEGRALCQRCQCPVVELTEQLFKELADTETPQGLLAVFARPVMSLDQLNGELVLILDQVRDPGNVGAIIRTAAAAGLAGIVAVQGSVDLTNAKVIRASMGGVFRIPWVEGVLPEAVVDWAKGQGYVLVGLAPRRGVPFHKYHYSGRQALVVGSEAAGMSEQLARACSDHVTIPMPGGSESLNVAMAATLVIYQALIARGL